jgi:hypothetical protein
MGAISISLLLFKGCLLLRSALCLRIDNSFRLNKRSKFYVQKVVTTSAASDSPPLLNEDTAWPSPLSDTERLARAAAFWWQVSPMVTGYAGLLIGQIKLSV